MVLSLRASLLDKTAELAIRPQRDNVLGRGVRCFD